MSKEPAITRNGQPIDFSSFDGPFFDASRAEAFRQKKERELRAVGVGTNHQANPRLVKGHKPPRHALIFAGRRVK